MSKYSKMKTSELLDLVTNVPDSEVDSILLELGIRYPMDYFEERIVELEEKIESLESKFKKHSHCNGKIYTELE